MSSLIIPISMIVKSYINLPYSLSQISIYSYFILVFFSMLLGRKIYINRLINTKIIIGVIAIIIIQTMTIFISHYEIGMSSFNLNPYKQIIKFLLFIFPAYFYFFVVSIMLQSKKDIKYFLQGIQFSLIGISLLCYIQLFYIFGISAFDGVIANVASLFEQRANREWYDDGSYVQTLHRINAIYQEAGYLAVILLVVFTPFILSSIKHQISLFNIDKKYSKFFYYILLINIIMLLFCIQSTTGLLAIALIGITLLLESSLKNKSKIIMFLITILLFIIYQYNQYGFIYETINQLIFNKAESSTDNRLGGTIGLIITWLQHFIIGIGWEYEDYYLFQNVPEWSRHNWEYINVFVVDGFYPILSMFFGWLTQFGTLVMVIIYIYIYRLLRDLKLFTHKLKGNVKVSEYKVMLSIYDAARYFILFYFIMSILSFDWKQPHYFVIFFFFVVYRQLLKEKLKGELK